MRKREELQNIVDVSAKRIVLSNELMVGVLDAARYEKNIIMENQIIELPKSHILLCREVVSGAYKDWSNTETINNVAELKAKKTLAAQLLLDPNMEADNIEIIKYDHYKITQALQIIELGGVPFDGHIEPKKYLEPEIKPFVSSQVKFRRETLEPVKPKYNIPFLVFCGLTLVAVLGYIALT